jgi:hypothetical protein
MPFDFCNDRQGAGAILVSEAINRHENFHAYSNSKTAHNLRTAIKGRDSINIRP